MLGLGRDRSAKEKLMSKCSVSHKIRAECPVALCKESAEVWDALGLDRPQCRCVCQYDYKDLT